MNRLCIEVYLKTDVKEKYRMVRISGHTVYFFDWYIRDGREAFSGMLFERMPYRKRGLRNR